MFKLRSISELCYEYRDEKPFFIPSFQRGYRWGTEHVRRLLDDLYEFNYDENDEKKQNKDYYCLQPITVNTTDDNVVVVDGQQRLTTIYIILKAFDAKDDDIFSMVFERDGDSALRKDYIKNINGAENADIVDFIFMRNTFDVALEWLEEKKKKLKKTGLALKYVDMINDARILWYEIENPETAYKVFSNLNSGKIKLTNSELIKAILLSILSDEAPVVARLWDEIGRTLNNDEFWAFICPKNKNKNYQTRIDYLFELCNKEARGFSWYEKELKARSRAEEIWKDVRNVFRTFQDWYRNIEYYNYVGLVVDDGFDISTISTILDWYKNESKTEFVRKLKEKACGFFNEEPDLESCLRGLQYGPDDDKIKKVLKLFNIITCCDMGERFNFIVKGDWSLEHIFAQNSTFVDRNDRKDWLKSHQHLLADKNNELVKKIEKIGEQKHIPDDEVFEGLFKEIYKALDWSVVNTHDLMNLALLGKWDNSKLGCKPFYEKRRLIIEEMQKKDSKVNIPLATKNVFLKRYSGVTEDFSGFNVNFILWHDADGEAYLKEILDKLSGLKKEATKVG